MADALSRKSMNSLAHITVVRRPLVKEMHKLKSNGVVMEAKELEILLAHIQFQASLVENVKKTQKEYAYLCKKIEELKNDSKVEFTVDSEGILRLSNRLCVPDKEELKKKNLEEAHRSMYTIHPEITKMYKDLKEIYW